jgi:aspartokinase/homoserine dehydrogenase 1
VLLDQLAGRADAIRQELGIDLRVRAIANSRAMHLAERRVDLRRWRQDMDSAAPFDLDQFLEHVQTDTLPHTMIVDCTSSEHLAGRRLIPL